jgi:hypothetical protein
MRSTTIGSNPDENAPSSVLVVLPSFGQLSEQLTDELHGACGADSTNTIIVFRESDYERSVGRFVSRLIRAVCGFMRLPIAMRERAEVLVHHLRFDQNAFVAELRSTIGTRTYNHIVLMKPMLLDEASFLAILRSSEAHRVTVVLWDALWRTPSIRSLLPLVTTCFTTEPSDVGRRVTLLSVPTKVGSDKSELGASPTNRLSCPSYFFCGSWSVERFTEAVRLRRSLKRHSSHLCVHLVTGSRILKFLGGRFGFHAESLSPEENRSHTQRCDVLIDLGRIGQSSPSERLAAAAEGGALLLTTNELAERVGFPMVRLRPSIDAAVLHCERQLRLHDRASIQQLWSGNEEAKSLLVSGPRWAEAVLR